MKELIYDTRKTRVIIFGFILGICIISMIFASSLLPLLVFIAFGSGLGLYSSVMAYRRLVLFPERVRMTDMFNKIIWEVQYSDIAHIGFLDGQDVFGNKYTSNEFLTEIMVIVLENKWSVQLDGNDFEEIHSIYNYIQSRRQYS